MRYLISTLLFVFPLMLLAQTPTQTENYIKSTTYQKGYIQGQEQNAMASEKITTIQYFDGLGRPIQNIGVNAGGQSQDIITHFSYDNLGRQVRNFLPYASSSSSGLFRTNALNETNTFYNTYKYENTTNPYSESFFDGTPLNLLEEQAAPGNAWKEGIVNEHTIKNEYKLITSADNVYNLQVSYNSIGTPQLINNGLFDVGETNEAGGQQIYPVYKRPSLYKFIVKNENWESADLNDNTTHTFKDFQGRTILLRTFENNVPHDTYYVYDTYGNLVYVTSPKVVISNGISSTELNELCYQYKYDGKDRLVEKKVPGKGWEYIIYDLLDRPALTQDANQRPNREWTFTKYDQLGRVAYTGIYTHAFVKTRLEMQNRFINQNNLVGELYEVKATSGTGYQNTYYSNSDYPKTDIEILTINYYDNYYFDKAGSTNTVNSYGVSSVSNPTSLETGSRIKVLGTSNWTANVTYYDSKSRPIHIYGKNDYLNTTDIVESKLDDFTGRVLETKTTHKKTGKMDIVTVDTYTYDHQGRVLEQNQYINNNEGELIARNHYDELGQLEQKDVGGKLTNSSNQFKDVIGLEVEGQIITKTAGNGYGNAGLATTGEISNDGYIEYEVTASNSRYLIGLSNSNANAHYNTIKYSIYNNPSGRVYVYELSSNKGQYGTYQAGDIFRVERIGSTIHFKKNGVTFYTSSTPSTGTLIGDISIFNTGDKIKNLHVNSNFTDLVGVTVTDNDVIHSASGSGWNVGLATKKSFDGDGFVAYEIPQTNKYLMVGLSNDNTNASYTTIDYAMYNVADGRLYVYESGSSRGQVGTYQVGDMFRVERIGTTVYYKQNGAVIYTSTVPSTGTLLGDVAMHTSGAQIKNLKIVDNTKGLQSIDYKYNVRGWLTDINDVDAMGDDLFNFKLNYNEPTEGYHSVGQLYNGNISQAIWRTANDNLKRGYAYEYDNLNRILTATSSKGSTLMSGDAYGIWGIAYDKNGNIERITRNGRYNGSITKMDELYYNYSNNKLNRVSDVTANAYAHEGFKDGTNIGNDYTYDVNGNMKTDANKGITNIVYNHLNLPTQVTLNGQNISYIYDANGVKIRKETPIPSPFGPDKTDYAGNYVYENGNLQFFNHAEGYVTPGANGEFNYVYQYKDHLGNVRLSYADSDGDGHITEAGVFSDNLENSIGWDSHGALYGSSASIDTQRKVSGNQSAKLVQSGHGEIYAHSNEWIPINNSVPTDYIFSGWIYAESPGYIYARISLFMNEDDETGYFTDVVGHKIYTKDQWVYVEQQVTVPANIDKLNLRINLYTSSSSASAWFDDLQIKKVAAAEIIEENNFYPFGLKHKGYNTGVGTGGNSTANNFKYNNKELNEALGLNWYDYGARNYDASLGRFFNVDPLADAPMQVDKSPYAYTWNNPINLTDPDGMHPDWNEEDYYSSVTIHGLTGGPMTIGSSPQREHKGGSIGVTKNKDGTYTVESGKDDGKTGIYLVDGKGNYNTKTSEKIGDQFTPHSFRADSNAVIEGAVINLESNDGQKFLDDLVQENPDVVYYAKNGKGGEKYDYKTNGLNQEAKELEKSTYKYRGSVLGNGKVASARDIGNIGAGIVAGRAGLTWDQFRTAADALETKQKGFLTREKVNSQLPQALGFIFGRNLRKKPKTIPKLQTFKH